MYWWTGLYDTIRDAVLTCDRQPTRVSLIYRTEPTAKKCKNRKTKSRKHICSEITVNSLGNPCSETWRRKRKGCSGKDLQKRKVLSLEWKSTALSRRHKYLVQSRCFYRCILVTLSSTGEPILPLSGYYTSRAHDENFATASSSSQPVRL